MKLRVHFTVPVKRLWVSQATKKKLIAYLKEIQPRLPTKEYLETANEIISWTDDLSPELFINVASNAYGYPDSQAKRIARILYKKTKR